MFCAAARIDRIVLGTLGHNPFPDATPAFRSRRWPRRCRSAWRMPLRIEAPYARCRARRTSFARGAALGVPFELTLSCMNPVPEGIRDSGFGIRGSRFTHESNESTNPKSPIPNLALRHCAARCRERHDAFLETGLADPTEQYADARYVNA